MSDFGSFSNAEAAVTELLEKLVNLYVAYISTCIGKMDNRRGLLMRVGHHLIPVPNGSLFF